MSGRSTGRSAAGGRASRNLARYHAGRTRRVFGGRPVMVADHPGAAPTGVPIVFVNGCAVSGALWGPVLRRCGTERRITFDRPGLAGTPWPGELPTLAQEVGTLVDLIEWVGAPVMLVAHSMAAFHAEAVARQRPDLVDSIVMVDGSVEWLDSPPPAMSVWPARLAHGLASAPPLHRLGGLVHRVGVGLQTANPLPGKVLRRFHQLYSDADSVAMGVAEAAAYVGQAWELLAVRGTHPMPTLPVRVLSATAMVPKHWRWTQRRWARLLGAQAQVDVDGSRHLMMLDRPDAIVEAIDGLRSAPGRA